MDIEHLKTWIDREESTAETLSPELAHRFNATFNWQSDCREGAPAPLLIHYCLGQPVVPHDALKEDGHPALGGFLPPVTLPRRMWAASSIEFHDSITIGDRVVRNSKIKDVTLKEGRSGKLCFVTVDHEVTSNGRIVLNERQDIVYRDIARPGTAEEKPVKKPDPAQQGEHSRHFTPTPPLLFRYSALTFNAHRIHYDATYAKEVEGYPGLIVHGPLQATLLCHFAAELKGQQPGKFGFRSLSPIFDTSDFSINASAEGEGLKLWTARTGGPVATEAYASW